MERLDVLYACNDNYAPYACVSIYSLLKNNRNIRQINIYIVLDNVSTLNLEILRKQAQKYGAKLVEIDAAPLILHIKSLGIPSYRGSYAANFRLFFDQFIAEDTERLLYLDCDTVIDGDLNFLLNDDMGEYCLYAVQESLADGYKKIIGFDSQKPYFNTGVLLIEVSNWKKQNCTSKIMNHLIHDRSAYCNPDQDLLNIVLADYVKYISPKYNYQPIHQILSVAQYLKIYNIESYYSEDVLLDAEISPVIYHTYRFLGEFPWHKGNLHPNTKLFDKYLLESEQHNYIKKISKVTLLFKIEKILYKMLPHTLFFVLFKKVQEISFYKQNNKLEGVNRNK